ncbi:MAG: hypothetical protein MZW92_16980 [Comamonadaceae bacterium]|nr:hypothetical protein [Comamonadaceae bacterium]
MDYQDALIIAMRREKSAFKLYNDLAAMGGAEEAARALPGLGPGGGEAQAAPGDRVREGTSIRDN